MLIILQIIINKMDNKTLQSKCKMQKIIFGKNPHCRQEMDQQINRCESIDGSTHRLSRDYSIL